MKFKMIAAAVMAVGMAMLAPNEASATRQNFTLINHTGYTIKEVYVSLTRVNDWQEDVLGEDELDTNSSVDITFPHHAGGCYWDLKVVYEDDTSAYWTNFNLCTISEITISYDRKSGKTWAHWK